jgi:hypothetical protein
MNEVIAEALLLAFNRLIVEFGDEVGEENRIILGEKLANGEEIALEDLDFSDRRDEAIAEAYALSRDD